MTYCPACHQPWPKPERQQPVPRCPNCGKAMTDWQERIEKERLNKEHGVMSDICRAGEHRWRFVVRTPGHISNTANAPSNFYICEKCHSGGTAHSAMPDNIWITERSYVDDAYREYGTPNGSGTYPHNTWPRYTKALETK